MAPLDKKYLLLQFRNKIYSYYGTEFQSFFENIMKKAIPNFRSVPPWGGDGGNDGWEKETGKYYQVYSPVDPSIKDADAAQKLKDDFYTLKENWDQISEIKEYYFVYNDKYYGSHKPERSISELERLYPSIKFDTFKADKLEQVFLSLSEEDLYLLDFDIDRRISLKNANSFLQIIKGKLDKENINSAQKILQEFESIFIELDDEQLNLEYELLNCKCIHKLEDFEAAKEKYGSSGYRVETGTISRPPR